MSELHHRYDRAAVAERITQPPFAALADKGRRRAHRARAVRIAGVAALAALAAAPLWALSGGGRPGRPVSPGEGRMWTEIDTIVTFLDIRHGVAQYWGDACGAGWVSVTRDGGSNWSELREHPTVSSGGEGGSTCSRVAARLIAPDTLVLAASAGTPPGRAPGVGEAGRAFISRDAGRTWRAYEPRVRLADAVPEGTVPSWPCDETACKVLTVRERLDTSRSEVTGGGLGWYDPPTGDWMVLRNQPPGTGYVGLSVGFDGSMWVYGAADGDFRLVVSRDRGRSWQDRTPAGGAGWLAAAGLVAHDGDTAYLYPHDGPGTDPSEMYRTTDGGRTWRLLPAVPRLAGIVFAWVDRDGGLTVADRAGKRYVSSDGGLTYARTEVPVWHATAIPGGLEGWPVDPEATDPVDLYLSEDGRAWRPVQVPYYQR